MQIAIVVTMGVAATLLGFGLLSLLAPEERRVKRRLEGLSEFEVEQAVTAEPLLQPFLNRVVKPAAHALAGAARHVSPGDYGGRARERLIRAGNPLDMTVETLAAMKIVGVVGAAVLALIVGLLLRFERPAMVISCLIALVVGFFLPDMWVASQTAKRRTAIRRALPDMLDMLTISVEAGLGFDAAVAKLVGNSKGPLADEFARTLQEIQAGIPRTEAFRHLSSRVDVPELSSFVTSMVQADVFGISVANVLRGQAKEMRTKRRQLAEETAQKAPVKLVFPLVLCILPATLIVILGPAIVSIGRAFGLLQ